MQQKQIKYPYFILFWCCLNLLQAYFTELTSDEGYYWFYSTKLELGYYDHPPMLAFLIHLGYFFFQNELGVRLFSVLLFSGSLFLFFELLPKHLRNNHWLYLFLLSVPILNYVNIVVFPDTPLLAFELLFLYAYQRFLKKENWAIIGLLGLSIGLMFYSKYHGVLVVGFTVLSNPRLFLNPKFYAASLIGLVLFLPHLWWQYDNDFPTFAYHLEGRINVLSTRFLFEYWSQQLLFFTPVLLICPIFYKVKNSFERTLKFIIIGSLLFFTYASLRTFVHFHWTSIAVIPAIILSTYFYENTSRKRLLNIGIGIFLFAMLTVRLYFMVQIFPAKNQNVDYYHDRNLWAEDLKKFADGKAILFENNLREAGLYRFYSGEEGVALYTGIGKKSQFELWDYETKLQGKPVLIVKRRPFEGSQVFTTRMGKKEHYAIINKFYSYHDIKIQSHAVPPSVLNDSLTMKVEIDNKRDIPLFFEEMNPAVHLVFYQKNTSRIKAVQWTESLKNIPAQTQQIYTLKVSISDLGIVPDYFYIASQSPKLNYIVNSNKIDFPK
jgi:hypothetical protein